MRGFCIFVVPALQRLIKFSDDSDWYESAASICSIACCCQEVSSHVGQIQKLPCSSLYQLTCLHEPDFDLNFDNSGFAG